MDDDKNTKDKTAEIQNAEFLEKLKEAGRLVDKEEPGNKKTKGGFVPVELYGKPLSEIAIEARQ